ncbi:hypothetical protein N7476_000255 [Penicillium atrosanguineum]|uniref:Sulfatase N-terminal domain-containing protein n=1 Tax=Penicillium atrosanguineum TaxID=1132637 RepID=A0A9W9QGB6_9EURO|nr:hypothetical protein N7476_000255 [Penicillium atrosanguineum]
MKPDFRSKDLLRSLLSPSVWFDVYWPASRKYFFGLLFIGDVICILIALFLTQNFGRRWMRVLAALSAIPGSLAISGLAAANISFYFQTGAEIHWRQAHYFHRDPAAIKTLLTGLTGMIIVEIAFSAVAWLSTPYLYNGIWVPVRILNSTVTPLFFWKRKTETGPRSYEQVARQEWDEENNESEAMLGSSKSPQASHSAQPSLLLRIVVGSVAIFVILLRCVRPSNTAYSFLSQTVIVTPFKKPPVHQQTSSIDLPPLEGDYSWLYNHTALGTPSKLDWLPEEQLAGFRDWYAGSNDSGALHYDPNKDPLKISNLDQSILGPLRDALTKGDINIKHVFLLKLESTRDDVFPLRKESHLVDLIRESFSGSIPEEVEERLANLTWNAERFTNTPSGFDRYDVEPYGGLHMTNAYTGDTFTLKSILASTCGIAPLVVDFNREYLHHMYEPCMPQLLSALNSLSNGTEVAKKSDDYTTWPWHSTFMQSIDDNYDNQNLLIPAMGFQDKITDKTITKDWENKDGKAPEKFNFWGYPEHELRQYFSKALKHSEKHHERLFITHLTGQTHHPWDMPPGQNYEELIHSSVFNHNKNINRYLNTIGVADKWLGELTEVLEEHGVANETLIVMVGDHGISLIEDGGITPYDNPHVANFHVPMVFSHPQLPPINIDGRVTSLQILPTILDLLVESASLDEKATHAIKDLLPLYEGQSMIRELVPEKDGNPDWQFTVMNTGATWLALRSANKSYRIVIPMVPDVEWRFSDIDSDPHEEKTLQSFTLPPLLEQVANEHGEEAVQWIKDAAHVAQWWVAENWDRYEFVPES